LYRIKQINFDGSFKYSNEIEVNLIHIMDFALRQNYPNPFNPVTTIGYQVPHENKVTIKVFDVLGNEVVVLINDVKQNGIHEVNFNASSILGGLPSG